MAKKKFYIVLGIIFLLFVVQHILIKQPDIIKKVKASDEFSNVEIETLDGSYEPVGYYKDRQPIVLLFWSSDCQPCELALFDLQKESSKFEKDYDALIIAVNLGEDEDQIRHIKSEWNIEVKIGLDPDKKVANEFGVGTIPTIVFIKKDGTIGKKWDKYDPDVLGGVRYRLSKDSKEDDKENEEDTIIHED